MSASSQQPQQSEDSAEAPLRARGRPFYLHYKFMAAGILVALALVNLAFITMGGASSYYVTVGELKAREDSLRGKSVRVSGKVVPGSIEKDGSSVFIRFSIADDANPQLTVPVEYNGVVPDMFKEDGAVVVEGKYTSQGKVSAKNVITLCASKYVPEDAKKS